MDRHIHLGVGVGRLYNHNTGKTSVAALLLAEPDHAPSEIQGGIQGCVYLANTLPGGLQGGPPVSGSELSSYDLKAVVKGKRSRASCAAGGTGPQSPKSPTKP